MCCSQWGNLPPFETSSEQNLQHPTIKQVLNYATRKGFNMDAQKNLKSRLPRYKYCRKKNIISMKKLFPFEILKTFNCHSSGVTILSKLTRLQKEKISASQK